MNAGPQHVDPASPQGDCLAPSQPPVGEDVHECLVRLRNDPDELLDLPWREVQHLTALASWQPHTLSRITRQISVPHGCLNSAWRAASPAPAAPCPSCLIALEASCSSRRVSFIVSFRSHLWIIQSGALSSDTGRHFG